MQPIRYRLVLAALGLALAAPLAAQETRARRGRAQPPRRPRRRPTPPAAPAAEAPADAPAAETPAAPRAPRRRRRGRTGADGAGGGDPGAGDPAQPEVMEIVRDTFGDWQVRCAPDGNECFMYQLAVDAEKNPVAEVSILKLPDAAEADAGVTVVTPLGTLLDHRRRACRSMPASSGSTRSPGAARSAASRASASTSRRSTA